MPCLSIDRQHIADDVVDRALLAAQVPIIILDIQVEPDGRERSIDAGHAVAHVHIRAAMFRSSGPTAFA